MTDVPISQWAPKFGDVGNSEPAVQGEVTINTYHREHEKIKRINEVAGVSEEDDDKVVFPYGRQIPKDTFSVKENEVALLVKEKAPNDKKRGFQENFGGKKPKGNKVDNYPFVLTSLNAMCIKTNTPNFREIYKNLPEEVQKAYIRKQFSAIGTIGTPFNPDSGDGRYNFGYFPTRLSGVYAMQNGPQPVLAGQFLMIDAPKPSAETKEWQRDRGLDALTDLPREKVTMELVPLDITKMPSFEALQHFITNLNQSQYDAIKRETENISTLDVKDAPCFYHFVISNIMLLSEMADGVFDSVEGLQAAFIAKGSLLKRHFDSYFMVRNEMYERIIGRALGHAKPGAQVDVHVCKGYHV